MPIRVTLDRMLLDRRMSLTELCDRVGITMANLSILKDALLEVARRDFGEDVSGVLIMNIARQDTGATPVEPSRQSEFNPYGSLSP